MASITTELNGRKSIQFVALDGNRLRIRLGKVSERYAETTKDAIEELLAAKRESRAASRHISRWVAEVNEQDPKLASKLARVGLIQSRPCRRGNAGAVPASLAGGPQRRLQAGESDCLGAGYRRPDGFPWGRLPPCGRDAGQGRSVPAIHAGGGPAGNHDPQAAATRPDVLCPRQAARFGGREPV